MNNNRKSQSRKATSFTLLIALVCVCAIASYFPFEVTNAQCFAKNNPDGQGQIAGDQKKSLQPTSQVRADNLLKDALRQSDKEKKNVGLESESVKAQSNFLADGSASDDEPLLQKFIKKLGSIIWG